MKKLAVLGMGLVVGILSVPAFAAPQKIVDVQAIQAELARTQATWRAKESWVTRLSATELKRMMGVQKAPVGNLDFEGVKGLAGPATSIDWRNKDGVNWLAPVMNQGNCGSCVAFATVATLEAQTSISAGAPWLHPTFSPGMLFACGGGGCDTGWMPDNAADFIKTTGIVDEACMPYTSGSTGDDQACDSQCSNSHDRIKRIVSYDTPTSYGGNIEEVKKALKNGPLVTTLMVYADFVTYASGVYKHATGAAVGGHAISIVGYDDTKRAWLIRNSWGQEWGDQGFAWISWDDRSGVGANTWNFQTGSSAGFAAVASPADRELVSGTYQLQARTQGLKAGEIKFHINDGTRDVGVVCTSSSEGACAADLDTTQLAEGRYEIYAESGTVRSQVREFFVLNSEPKLELSFKPASGTNLGKPLTGRPEFNVTAGVKPVPIQHIEFRAIDSTGKIAARKSNDLVLAQMLMGWRTVTVPNGAYKLQFHGETRYKGKIYSVDSNSFDVTVKN